MGTAETPADLLGTLSLFLYFTTKSAEGKGY